MYHSGVGMVEVFSERFSIQVTPSENGGSDRDE